MAIRNRNGNGTAHNAKCECNRFLGIDATRGAWRMFYSNSGSVLLYPSLAVLRTAASRPFRGRRRPRPPRPESKSKWRAINGGKNSNRKLGQSIATVIARREKVLPTITLHDDETEKAVFAGCRKVRSLQLWLRPETGYDRDRASNHYINKLSLSEYGSCSGLQPFLQTYEIMVEVGGGRFINIL